MKKSIGANRLGIGGSVEITSGRLVIRLPDLLFLRLLARSVLLAAVLLCLLWFHAALLGGSEATASLPAIDRDAGFLPTLGDLTRWGLLRLDDNAIFLGCGAPVSDGSANFVFSASAGYFEHVDRILKVSAVAALRLGRDPSESFTPPENYRMAYMGKIGSTTAVAVRKSSARGGGLRLRRLLAVEATKKKKALSGLEDAMLEPPEHGRQGWNRNARFLPELTRDALDDYPRRVFVEVASAGKQASGAVWFGQNYPKKGRAFDVIRVEVKDEKHDDKAAETDPEELGTPSMAEWLERNVKEEEYVVVKAEAADVEEAVAEGAIGLVDELFLECDHQWEDDDANESGRRAYWECLTLYGKLRDAGVAVHQWWGS